MSAPERWWNRPAARWQFWNPQSGLVGGLIMGSVLFAITAWIVKGCAQ